MKLQLISLSLFLADFPRYATQTDHRFAQELVGINRWHRWIPSETYKRTIAISLKFTFYILNISI